MRQPEGRQVAGRRGQRTPRTTERGAGRRTAVLQALRAADGPLGIAAIAAQVDVHPNTVRFHLATLVEHGRVERVELLHRTPGRPPQLFRATTGMDPSGPRAYRQLAEVLVDTLTSGPNPRRRAAAAGRSWGRRLVAEASHTARGDSDPGPEDTTPVDPDEAIGRLSDLLEQMGFAPEPAEGGDTQIGLRHCPFLELAKKHQDVVCPIHLGLMRGAMQAWRSPVSIRRLESFTRPDLCTVHLSPAGTAS